MNLAELESDGEKLHESLGREHYATLSGQKAEPEFQRIYETYSHLTSDDALATVREAQSAPLVEWVVGNRVGRKLARFDELQLTWELETRLEIGGVQVDYHRVPIDLANSADREYRLALDSAKSEAVAQELNPILRDRFLAEHEEMRLLGYDDYVAAIGELAGIDFDALGRSASAFLRDTGDMYRASLEPVVRQRLDVPVEELVRADTAWTFRADQYDHFFPPDRLVELAQRQMIEMGLDALQGGRVRLDTEDRPGKQARAFCVPVRVPEEVYLVTRPHGGNHDYRTFWHELGHAMHFTSPSPEASFADRWLGDNSVTEGFAMLWDHLTMDPGWLTTYTDLDKAEARTLARELAVQELHLLRRYAAKMQYELSLHRSDLGVMGAEYATRLSEATGFRYSESDYLVDVDTAFYAARYLRAWQTEARLSSKFRERFDDDWYRNPNAGLAVAELMARGQATSADRLVQEVTGSDLSFGPIISRVEALLD